MRNLLRKDLPVYDVVILGAGITGLSAAYHLKESGISNFLVIDAAPEVGGKIRTINENGYTIETAADSFISGKPYITELLSKIGLDNQIVEPLTNQFQILNRLGLSMPPKGLKYGVPTDLLTFQQSDYFSSIAKEQILNEVNVEADSVANDESLGSFMERRFGLEMLQKYAEPLFSGIYATPIYELGIKSTFPFLKKWESEYGSVTAAVNMQNLGSASGISRSAFLGLKNGMQSLPLSMKRFIGEEYFLLSHTVAGLEHSSSGYKIHIHNGRIIEAKSVIYTIPLYSLKNMLNNTVANFELYPNFSTSSSLIYTLAIDKSSMTSIPEGTGFVSTSDSSEIVSAATYTSNKWIDRSPDDIFLVRAFAKERIDTLKISDITTSLKSIWKSDFVVKHSWNHIWKDALPQYKVGHQEAVKALREGLEHFNGFEIAGCALEGVGIPDCIRQGIEAAQKLIS